MSKPIEAVVGRPNEGKSTLINKLCGQRLAIVEDTPGITRDRIFANCEWSGHEFMLVDTGGIEPKATEGILAHMREQAEIAFDSADCIIMVVDVRDGLTAADCGKLGYKIVTFPVSCLFAQTAAIMSMLKYMKELETDEGYPGDIMEFADYLKFVNVDHYKELGAKYLRD